MGIADDARRSLEEAGQQVRREERALRAKTESTESQLRRIIGPLAVEFAQAAKAHSGLFTRRWTFKVIYWTGTSGDGYTNLAEAYVVVRRNGTCDLAAPTAAYGVGEVDEEAVRRSVTKALADVLKGK